jgi:hypothetical protein
LDAGSRGTDTLAGMARGSIRSSENPETPRSDAPNAAWFKPVMFGFMLVGLLWIIVYYLSQTSLPVPSLGPWNIMVGFGIMFIGFLMTTRWR